MEETTTIACKMTVGAPDIARGNVLLETTKTMKTMHGSTTTVSVVIRGILTEIVHTVTTKEIIVEGEEIGTRMRILKTKKAGREKEEMLQKVLCSQ